MLFFISRKSDPFRKVTNEVGKIKINQQIGSFASRKKVADLVVSFFQSDIKLSVAHMDTPSGPAQGNIIEINIEGRVTPEAQNCLLFPITSDDECTALCTTPGEPTRQFGGGIHFEKREFGFDGWCPITSRQFNHGCKFRIRLGLGIIDKVLPESIPVSKITGH